MEALVEGNSVRSTCRMTGTAKGTVLSLLEEADREAQKYHDETVRDLDSQRIQFDEIWRFCCSTEQNVAPGLKGKYGYGDICTSVVLYADTKPAVSWLVGDREVQPAEVFMQDVDDRLSLRMQLTADGHNPYLEEGYGTFGGMVLRLGNTLASVAEPPEWLLALPITFRT